MKILQSVKKIPGGLMVIPLFLGAAFNTFLPGLITLGGSGTFTSHLWKSGAMPIPAQTASYRRTAAWENIQLCLPSR